MDRYSLKNRLVILIVVLIAIFIIYRLITVIINQHQEPSVINNSKVEYMGYGLYSVNFGNYGVEVQSGGTGKATVLGLENKKNVQLYLQSISNGTRDIYVNGKGEIPYKDLTYVAEELNYTTSNMEQINSIENIFELTDDYNKLDKIVKSISNNNLNQKEYVGLMGTSAGYVNYNNLVKLNSSHSIDNGEIAEDDSVSSHAVCDGGGDK